MGIVLSDSNGQGDQLWRRGRDRRFSARLATMANILAIRFPGYDPERLLTFLSRYVGWWFSRKGLIVWGILVGVAACLVSSNLGRLQADIAAQFQFDGLWPFVSMVVVLSLTKVCHELGHGLACHRFGGECHEMGVMLLVFTPAMYCETSDSWCFPNKWHRATVGAAGMYVEIAIAALATIVWWATIPWSGSPTLFAGHAYLLGKYLSLQCQPPTPF